MTYKQLMFKRILFTMLAGVMILFIFINSSLDADSSTVHSTGVREFVNSLLKSLNIPIVFSEFFVRKCAHFAEYFVLGTLLFYAVKSYFLKLDARMILSPSFGLVVASIDETIQFFTEGRSAQFTDVLLDLSAVITAFLIFFIISFKIDKIKGRKEEIYNE